MQLSPGSRRPTWSSQWLERVEDLIEGVWNTCSDVLDEWGISEIEEYLETLTPKLEVVEQSRPPQRQRFRM